MRGDVFLIIIVADGARTDFYRECRRELRCQSCEYGDREGRQHCSLMFLIALSPP